jgi:hypothetical protein
MTGLHFVPGFTASTYWGFVKCTTDDLAALMGHVLASPDRDYLVGAMRGVAPNQRWGSGARARPSSRGTRTGGRSSRIPTASTG